MSHQHNVYHFKGTSQRTKHSFTGYLAWKLNKEDLWNQFEIIRAKGVTHLKHSIYILVCALGNPLVPQPENLLQGNFSLVFLHWRAVETPISWLFKTSEHSKLWCWLVWVNIVKMCGVSVQMGTILIAPKKIRPKGQVLSKILFGLSTINCVNIIPQLSKSSSSKKKFKIKLISTSGLLSI